MFVILMALTGWAEDAVMADYPSLSMERLAPEIELVPTGNAAPPDGVRVTWTGLAGFVELELSNESAAVVEVDWNRSAFVHADGQSVGVIPGTTKVMDSGRETPPSIIPPGARLEEYIIREDAVSLGDVEPLITVGDIEQEVGVTLALACDGQPSFISEQFRVVVDRERLAVLDANYNRFDQGSSRLIEVDSEVSGLEAEGDKKKKIGIALLATGAVAMVGVPAQQSTEDMLVVGIGGAAIAGAGGYFLAKRSSNKRRAEALREESLRLQGELSSLDLAPRSQVSVDR